jgi:hypothetical protein
MATMINSNCASTSILQNLGPLDSTTFQPTSCVESKKKTWLTCEGKVKGYSPIGTTT